LKKLKIFKKEFERWRSFFSVDYYSVYFELEKTDDFYAKVYTQINERIATVVVNDKWLKSNKTKKEDISQVAFHEAFEVALAELVPYTLDKDQTEVSKIFHNIINLFENKAFKILNKEINK